MLKKKISFIFLLLFFFVLLCTTKAFAADYRVGKGETLEVKFSSMNVGATYYKSCSSNDESIATVSETTKGITAYINIKGESVGNTTITVSAGKLTGGATHSKTFTVEVYNKATKPTAASNLRYDGSVKTGVASGEGYTLSGVYQATTAGDYTAIASLEAGYEWNDGTTDDVTINWSILPMLVTIPEGKSGLQYTGTEQVGVESSAYYNLSGETSGTLAKSYTATATLKDTTNCTWTNGTTSSVNVQWEIGKKVLKNPSLTITSIRYTGREINIYDFLQNFNADLMNISIGTVKEVKDYNINITLKDSSNYVFENSTSSIDLPFSVINVEIADTIYVRKGQVTTIKFGDLGFEYDVGPAHYSSRQIDDGTILTSSYRQEELIYVYIDLTGLKEGTTIMSITAESMIGTNKKTKYYKVIVPYEVEIPTAKEDLVYNKTEQTGVEEGTGYTLSNNKATNAGEYQATATLSSIDYMWNDGTRTDKTIDWEIARKKINVPTAKENLVYNGTVQTGVDSGEGYTLSNEKATNAGKHQATASLDSNHMWSDETIADKTIDWEIGSKELTSSNISVTNDLIFNGSLQKIKVKGKDGEKDLVEDVDYKLKSGYEYIYAGKYYATVEFIGNYKGTVYNVEWDIAKKEIEIPNVETGLVYNGTEQVGIEESEDYNIEGTSKAINAGQYNAIVKLLDKNNYVWSDKTTEDKAKDWEIAKAKYTYNKPEGYQIDYSKETLTINDLFEISFDGENIETESKFDIEPKSKFHIRKKGNNNYEPSDWALIEVVDRQKKSQIRDVRIESVEATTIRVKKVDGYEYSLDGVNWQDSNVFENLNEKTTYKIYQRVKATKEAFCSEEKSTEVKTPEKIIEETKEEIKEEKTEEIIIKKVENPKTGDNVIIYAFISIISIISLVILKAKK